ncbi:MAG: FAD-dependent oxidoreductase [Candidatus Hydrogenedentes bacterium]|nr:FAD-dependent oxidoreductase [Candidatus Hydrogenedentota bacterium]
MSNLLSRRALLTTMASGAALAAANGDAAAQQAPGGMPAGGAQTLEADVCVVGGGSGGVGAALAAARMGADVVLVEKNQMLGGTSTCAWVHTWEPSRGCRGIPQDVWKVMKEDPAASLAEDYEASLQRVGGVWLPWEPWGFQWAVTRLLEETGKCRVLYNATFFDVEMDGGRIESVLCTFAGGLVKVRAPIVIDCTADGNVCVAAGCDYRIGEDPKSAFDEPNAPDEPTLSLNSLTLLYRITDTGEKQTPFAPAEAPKCPRSAALRTCGNGDILVNAVNMIPGNAVLHADLSRILALGVRLVYDHFRWMQTEDTRRDFSTWTIAGVAPEIGVRETRRIVGEYTLTEHDCQAGVKNQQHEDIIAITDHAVDIHGPKHKLYEVPNGAYGVPYRCLLAKGTENLLIACRGASFSHIAASSCRLSRAMMTLGQAAGTAAAVCARDKTPLRAIDVPALRQALTGQGVELA